MSTPRDELFWAGMMVEFPANPAGSRRRRVDTRGHEPDIDDLRKRIESMVPYFCANPGCIQALCPYHRRGFSKFAIASNNIFLSMIQHDLTRLSHRPYPELRVISIPQGRPVGVCASGKLTPRLK